MLTQDNYRTMFPKEKIVSRLTQAGCQIIDAGPALTFEDDGDNLDWTIVFHSTDNPEDAWYGLRFAIPTWKEDFCYYTSWGVNEHGWDLGEKYRDLIPESAQQEMIRILERLFNAIKTIVYEECLIVARQLEETTHE